MIKDRSIGDRSKRKLKFKQKNHFDVLIYIIILNYNNSETKTQFSRNFIFRYSFFCFIFKKELCVKINIKRTVL